MVLQEYAGSTNTHNDLVGKLVIRHQELLPTLDENSGSHQGERRLATSGTHDTLFERNDVVRASATTSPEKDSKDRLEEACPGRLRGTKNHDQFNASDVRDPRCPRCTFRNILATSGNSG